MPGELLGAGGDVQGRRVEDGVAQGERCAIFVLAHEGDELGEDAVHREEGVDLFAFRGVDRGAMLGLDGRGQCRGVGGRRGCISLRL